MTITAFWQRVGTCDHANLSPDYYLTWPCMEYCRGSESHCLDCGAYLSKCPCHCCDGASGWPERRHNAERRKKMGVTP